MITAISILLYAVAVFCALVAGHELGVDNKSKKYVVKFFLAALVFFFILAALLQVFG